MFLAYEIRPSNPFRENGQRRCEPAQGVGDVEDPDTCHSVTVVQDRSGVVVMGSEKGNGFFIGFDDICRGEKRAKRGIGHLDLGVPGMFPHALFDPGKKASSLSGVDTRVLGESFEGRVQTGLEVRAFSAIVKETTKLDTFHAQPFKPFLDGHPSRI